MPRQKERKLIIHQPSVVEVIHCLASMPNYSRFLAAEMPTKAYVEFLQKLLDINFFSENTKRLTVKQIALYTYEKETKVTKWVHEIYEDILALLYDKPAPFKTTGTILTTLNMKRFDSYCSIKVYLPVVPKKWETFSFDFAKAKTGTYMYQVKNVTHEISNDAYEVTLELSGELENEYREMLLNKALFYNRIGFMDSFNKRAFEIDEILMKIYKG